MDETRDTIGQFPPGRYGRRRAGAVVGPGFRTTRRVSKWLTGLAALVVVVAGVAIAYKLYDQYGDREYHGQVLAFDTAEDSVSITFEVYKPAGESAVCRVRARSADGAQVGMAEVMITATEPRLTVEYTLMTTDKPVTGELQRCYAASLADSRLADQASTRHIPTATHRVRGCRTPLIRINTSVREDAIVSQNNPTGAWLTQEAHDRLAAELAELIAGRPAMAAEINARREEGDLKENGGYHAAKEEQGKMESRIRYLEDLLRTAEVGEAPSSREVAAGSVVTVAFDEDPDDTETFLLGSREMSATTDLTVYSPESALGTAILGHAEGDTVTYEAPSGAQLKVKIVKLASFEG